MASMLTGAATNVEWVVLRLPLLPFRVTVAGVMSSAMPLIFELTAVVPDTVPAVRVAV